MLLYDKYLTKHIDSIDVDFTVDRPINRIFFRMLKVRTYLVDKVCLFFELASHYYGFIFSHEQ